MPDFGDSSYSQDDDMTPAQRMASVISPDDEDVSSGDDSTGPTPPSHPDVAAQPPVASPTPALETTQPTQTAMIPPSFANTTATPAAPTLSPAEQALKNAGPTPQYDTAKLAQLEQQRERLSTPIDPSQPQYKPSIWNKVDRGLGAWLMGGPGAALAVNYNAPNRRYGVAEAARQGQLTNVNEEIGDLDKESAEQDKNYNAKLNAAKEAVTLQKNEDTAAAKAETNKVRQDLGDQLNTVRQQNLQLKQDQALNRVPKTYEETVAAYNLETDPVRKAALGRAMQTMEQMEIKKFKYAAQGNGDPNTSKRQSMIDKATQDIKDLQDNYEYDPDGGVYVGKKDQIITPQQFTDMKNAVATKLDQQLALKKLKPLGVRFAASDASWRDAQGLGRKAGKGGVAPETLNTPTPSQPTRSSQQQAAQPNMPPQSSAQRPTQSRLKATTSVDGLTVSARNPKTGKDMTYTFKTKDAANEFKQEAGLE